MKKEKKDLFGKKFSDAKIGEKRIVEVKNSKQKKKRIVVFERINNKKNPKLKWKIISNKPFNKKNLKKYLSE